MGVVEAVVGYGIGLAVLGIVVAYAIRGYRRVRRDDAQQLARKDVDRPKVSDSAHYVRTLPNTPDHPVDSKATQRSTAGPSRPYDYDQQC